MGEPLISICIPTYNRADCLKQNLDSIVVQFNDAQIRNKVEVIVSDNASTDNTAEIVKSYQNRFDNIRYYQNSENIGFDRNLLNVVEKSTGEYCLTIGDDDALFPDSLALLLDKIESSKAPYYMLNCWGYDHWLEKPVLTQPNRLITSDQVYDSLSSFVKNIKSYLDLVGNFGSMSTQLFLREMWAKFGDKKEYIGTNTIHLYILLSIFKNSKFVLLASPVIKTRNDNLRWSSYPGFETSIKRSLATIKTVFWIKDLYELSISRCSVCIYYFSRSFVVIVKEAIKKILNVVGLRKMQ